MSTAQAVTVLHLAEDMTRLHRVTARELAGACPFCGGADRFHVSPARDRWMCRHCRPKWSDAIDFVRARDGCGYRDACRALGVAPGEHLPRPVQADQEPARDVGSPQYIAALEEAQRRAFGDLWGTPAGRRVEEDGSVIRVAPSEPHQGAREALRFLAGRGIREDTARAWGLGYATGETVPLRQGPPPWPSLSVPGPGLLIPWTVGGALWQMKIRLLHPKANGPKILHPRWTDPARNEAWPPPSAAPVMFGADTLQGRDVAVLVEGELDAVLLAQEVGDLVGVCTLGSASARLPDRAIGHLLPLRRILVAYDADDAGRDGAARLKSTWPGLPLEVIHLPSEPTFGKDITDLHRAGGSLRRWVRFHLER